MGDITAGTNVFHIFTRTSSERFDLGVDNRLDLVSKLLLLTTWENFHAIDPVCIYLNVFNYVQPGVIRTDSFVDLLSKYYDSFINIEFDQFLAKFQHANVNGKFVNATRHGSNINNTDICSLFHYMTCLIGRKLKDDMSDELFHRFVMACSGTHKRDALFLFKPSHNFAKMLHANLQFSNIKWMIMNHIFENFTKIAHHESASLMSDVLAGAGLEDFIAINKILIDNWHKLREYPLPSPVVRSIISAVKRYDELGEHCMLRNTKSSLKEFEAVYGIKQFMLQTWAYTKPASGHNSKLDEVNAFEKFQDKIWMIATKNYCFHKYFDPTITWFNHHTGGVVLCKKEVYYDHDLEPEDLYEDNYVIKNTF